MRIHQSLFAIALCALASSVYGQNPQDRPPTAQPPVRPTEPPRIQPPPAPPATTTPPSIAQPPQVMNAPSTDSSAQQPVLSSAPRMIGDFPGYFACSPVTVQSTVTTLVPITRIIPNDNGTFTVIVVGQEPRTTEVTDTYKFCTVALSRGAFKIAENESVQPQDRFFANYNYFHDVPVRNDGAMSFATAANGTTTVRTATLTDINVEPIGVHRETIGFEKTFLNGNASVGARLPVFQTSQSAATAGINPGQLAAFSPFPTTGSISGIGTGFDGNRVGDLSLVFKYAFINDVDAGRVLASGLVVTAPTGGGIPINEDDRLYSTLLQPYVGFLQNYDRFFVHGFSSVVVPTDARDIVLLFNDVGLGYMVYRADDDSLLQSIVPTVEGHLVTPLSQGSGGITASDVFVMTGGAHFGLGRHTVLTLGAATPVTGPRPFTVEAMAQLNWLY
jgi:hypothetical protein